jgi:hypothetical protein
VSDLAASLPAIGRTKVDAFWWLIDQLHRHGTSREAITDGSWYRLSTQRAALMGANVTITNAGAIPISSSASCAIGNARWYEAEAGWRAIRIVLMEALSPHYYGHKGYEKLSLQRSKDSNGKCDAYYQTEWHLAMLVDHIIIDGGRPAADALWANPIVVAKEHLSRVSIASGKESNHYYLFMHVQHNSSPNY